jgi:hypothetical protein
VTGRATAHRPARFDLWLASTYIGAPMTDEGEHRRLKGIICYPAP